MSARFEVLGGYFSVVDSAYCMQQLSFFCQSRIASGSDYFE